MAGKAARPAKAIKLAAATQDTVATAETRRSVAAIAVQLECSRRGRLSAGMMALGGARPASPPLLRPHRKDGHAPPRARASSEELSAFEQGSGRARERDTIRP